MGAAGSRFSSLFRGAKQTADDEMRYRVEGNVGRAVALKRYLEALSQATAPNVLPRTTQDRPPAQVTFVTCSVIWFMCHCGGGGWALRCTHREHFLNLRPASLGFCPMSQTSGCLGVGWGSKAVWVSFTSRHSGEPASLPALSNVGDCSSYTYKITLCLPLWPCGVVIRRHVKLPAQSRLPPCCPEVLGTNNQYRATCAIQRQF